jgi:hypothetical protein
MNRPFALLLTLAGIVAASEADAQHVVYSGSATPGRVYYSPTYSSSFSAPATASQPTRTYTYSYYSRSGLPARTYIGFGGGGDFPFYGQPYGHPYDAWTWPMMSGSYGNGLARYYDPPVK